MVLDLVALQIQAEIKECVGSLEKIALKPAAIITSMIFLAVFSHALMTVEGWTPEIFWITDYRTALIWSLFEIFFSFPLGLAAVWYVMSWLHDRPKKVPDAFTDQGEWMG